MLIWLKNQRMVRYRTFQLRYDGDTQQTLELLINEKNHRKLHRECDGDYSQLATRLAVEGDRLLLKPLVQAAEP